MHLGYLWYNRRMKNNLVFGFATALSLASATAFAQVKFSPTCVPSSVYAAGIEDVAKLSEYRKDGKLAEGEAFLNSLRGPEQFLSMARFALYRDDKTKTDEMNALLKRVVEADETSFWGTAALGLLRMRGASPVTLYWPWKKSDLKKGENTIVYGVDYAFRKSGHYSISVKGEVKISAIELKDNAGGSVRLKLPCEFDLAEGLVYKAVTLFVDEPGDGDLYIRRHGLKPRAKAKNAVFAGADGVAAKYILDIVDKKTIDEILENERGADFLRRFFADKEWTEQFAGSGPWGCQSRQGMDLNTSAAASALKALDLIVWNDDGSVFTDKSARAVATALSLNHGATHDGEWIVEVYKLYRDWLKDGSLIPEAKNYDVREWREVVGFGQNVYLTPEDYAWSHAFVRSVKPEECGALCWQCSYRLFNCFGDSIHGPDYYKPWEHRLLLQEERYYVGGVCGSLSKFGSLIAATHGVKSFTAGQPAHCAYMLWDYAKNRWNIAYSVTGHTMPHNSLGGSTFAAACEQQRYFAHPDRMEAERLRWQGKYEEAMRKVPGNWCAAIAWFDKLERGKASAAEYDRYAKAVLETFSEMPSEGYQLYLPYLAKLSANAARVEAAEKALLTFKESPTDEVEAAYFDEIALKPLMSLFDKDPEARWRLFSAALDGQAGTKTFYRQAINWASSNLITDDVSMRKFIRVVGASVEKTGEAIDYREMLVAASQKGDIEMFRQVYALMDKCSPELRTKRTGKTWPKEKSGAKLLSCDGVLMTSTTSPWDWPLSYRDALAAEDYEEGNTFHTARESAPWGMVKLPGPAEIKAITVVNSGAGQNRSRQIPLSVWTSEDGKNFTLLSTFTKVQDEWMVELVAPVKARYVKVGRTPDDRNEVFHLHKILVYGKKLY